MPIQVIAAGGVSHYTASFSVALQLVKAIYLSQIFLNPKTQRECQQIE